MLSDLEDWPTQLLAFYGMGKLYERQGEYFKKPVRPTNKCWNLPTQEINTYVHAAYRLGKLEFQRNHFQVARNALQSAYNAARLLSHSPRDNNPNPSVRIARQ